MDPTPESLVGLWTLPLEVVFTEFYGLLGLYSAPPRPLPTPGPSTVPSLKPPPAVYDDGSVRSLTSLGSFPEPPTHFPIPPLVTSFSSNAATNTNTPVYHHNPTSIQGDGPLQSRTFSDISGAGSGPTAVLSRVTESLMEESTTPALTNGSSEPSQAQPMKPLAVPTPNGRDATSAAAEHSGPNSDVPGEAKIAPSPPASNIESSLPPVPVSASPPLVSDNQPPQQDDLSPAFNSRNSSSTGTSSTFRRGDYLDNREFGVDSTADAAQSRAKTLDSAQRRIEGSDSSKGNGGVVAAIRDKYTRAVSGCFRCPSYRLHFR